MVEYKNERIERIVDNFKQIRGVENGIAWNLYNYMLEIKSEHMVVKGYFIHKYYMTTEVMKQILKVFEEYDVRIEADEDSGRLVLIVK